jgi:hypothetical protein
MIDATAISHGPLLQQLRSTAKHMLDVSASLQVLQLLPCALAFWSTLPLCCNVAGSVSVATALRQCLQSAA